MDPDERIRGIQRATAIGAPEAIALLVDALERGKEIKADTRALLATARGLARFADQERARAGLLTIVSTGNPGLLAGRLPTTRSTSSGDFLEEGDPIARAELARQVAAIALARSGGHRAIEALYGAARGGGFGQNAALLALGRFPPRDPGFFGTTGSVLPIGVIRMLGQLGDLRALDVLHAATRSSDIGTRCAALVSLAELGDERAIGLARTAIAESDIRLRGAAGEVFILLAAPERFKATAAIVADDATTAIGLKMAERVFNAEITKLVAARAWEHPDRELRASAIRALGRSPDPNAATALASPSLLADRELAYLALHALARSPAPNAVALLEELLHSRPVRQSLPTPTGGAAPVPDKAFVASLAARAYVVRALLRGERSGTSDRAVFALASSQNKAQRALGVFARVALGDAEAESYIDDADPRVRSAVAMASMARPTTKSLERMLLERLAKEQDPIARQVLAVGLRGGDPEGIVKTSMLIDRAESAGGDAPLSAFVFARRADDSSARRIGQLLGSKDPVMRVQAARGLAVASLPDATGRLAELYVQETDVDVRRAVITALAARKQDAKAPARKETLELAAELDPDGPVRQAAARALAGTTTPFLDAPVQEVAWLRITLHDGAPPGEFDERAKRARSGEEAAFAGSVVRSDGVAVPIAFDDDGFALVPGLPPGESRLVLAPRLPAYKEAKQP